MQCLMLRVRSSAIQAHRFVHLCDLNNRPGGKREFYRYMAGDARGKSSRSNIKHNNNKPNTPDLIYMPHVVRWLKSKLRLKYLKRIWDPEFSEGAFIYGSSKAVCRITEIINTGKVEELDGLMTISAKIKLLDDIAYRLTETQKNLILLKPEDIKILVPISVKFAKEDLKKICRIALRVLALKWHEQSSDVYKLVLVALQTEFTRVYAKEAASEWIISAFSVLECAMLTEATATR